MKESKNPIIKVEDLPEKEEIYMKKSFDGWRIVYPIKREDGTMNWFNFLTGGSWGKLIKIIFILALILGVSLSYAHDTKECRELISNPCLFFTNITAMCADTRSFLSSGELGNLGDLGVNVIGEEP